MPVLGSSAGLLTPRHSDAKNSGADYDPEVDCDGTVANQERQHWRPASVIRSNAAFAHDTIRLDLIDDRPDDRQCGPRYPTASRTPAVIHTGCSMATCSCSLAINEEKTEENPGFAAGTTPSASCARHGEERWHTNRTAADETDGANVCLGPIDAQITKHESQFSDL